MEEKQYDVVSTKGGFLGNLLGQTWIHLLLMISVLCSAGIAAFPLAELHRYDKPKMIFWIGGIALSALLFISSLVVKKMKCNRFSGLTFFALFSFAVPGMLLMAQIFFDVDHFVKPPLEKILLYIFFGLLLTSFLLSIAGLLGRRGKADFLVSLAVFILFTSQIGLPILFKQVSYYYNRKHPNCCTQLKMLSVALEIHKNDYDGNISNPVKWCDVLHRECDVETERFQCPKDLFGPCSYAMNENIPADAEELPGDLVLLFESAPGWNQTGGANDVVTDRHGRPGANIAFADGRVEFVEAEEIPNLRWTVEE
ncbi:MAG: hypothetical protein H8E62_05550 [Planctomycetes bacterium]|nr:hypothetical protein [Planctomycetota bacterium]